MEHGSYNGNITASSLEKYRASLSDEKIDTKEKSNNGTAKPKR